MFKREEIEINKEGRIDEVETIIGPSVKVDGDFAAAGDVIVEGTLTGNLRTERSLRVGQSAKIFANVSAGTALVAGEVQGNVKIKDSLELTETSKIFGDVKAKTLSMKAGAILVGKTTIGEDHRSKKEEIKKEEKVV